MQPAAIFRGLPKGETLLKRNANPELRNCRVCVYYYEQEKESVKAKADAVGQDLSAYLRNISLGAKLSAAPSPEYMRINERLGKIADNSTDLETKEEIYELLDRIRYQMQGKEHSSNGSYGD